VADDRFLVAGLGNPGPRYAATRHNAGFLVLELLAERIGGRFKAHRSNSDVLEGRLAGRPVVLVKPRSYMNDSGGPVGNAARFYKVPVESGGPVVGAARFFKVPAEDIVVIHDELDLPFGALRIKRGGGDGGHNGLRAVTSALGSKEYLRVRFGIGRPPGRQDPADFVLREWSSAEKKDLGYHVDRAADAVEALLANGLEHTQNAYH
jgi:PTH1 family peptidyl-tRNA hydrolase